MAAEIRRAPIASPRARPARVPAVQLFRRRGGHADAGPPPPLPTRPTLPRRPEPTLPDPVKLAVPEPADPATIFRRDGATEARRSDVPIQSATPTETSRAFGPLGRFLRGAARGVRSNVPHARGRLRVFARRRRVGGCVLRRRSPPRGAEPRVAAPRTVRGHRRAAARRSVPRGPGHASRSFPRRDASRGGARSVLPREGGVGAQREIRRRRGQREATASTDVDGIARVPRSRRAVRTLPGARALRTRSRGVHDGARRVVDERVAGSREVQPASTGSRRAVPGQVHAGIGLPGLAAKLKVTCAATRPGEYVDEVIITTERQVFALSLSARVAGLDDAENAFAGGGETSQRFRPEDEGAVRLDPNLTLDELRERARFGGGR